MMRTLGFVLIFAIALVHANDQYTVDHKKACGPHMFKGMAACCKLPELVPFESLYPSCLPKEEETKQGTAQANSQKTSGEVGKTNGGRMCMLQCGMRNEKLLKPDGRVNTTAVNAKLMAIAEDYWDNRIIHAVENCTAEFNNLDLSAIEVTKDQNGDVCRPGPALYVSCINHRLTCDCPSNALGTADVLCPERLAYLRKCNPFSLIDGWKRKAGSEASSSGRQAAKIGGRSLKTKKNTNKNKNQLKKNNKN